MTEIQREKNDISTEIKRDVADKAIKSNRQKNDKITKDRRNKFDEKIAESRLKNDEITIHRRNIVDNKEIMVLAIFLIGLVSLIIWTVFMSS